MKKSPIRRARLAAYRMGYRPPLGTILHSPSLNLVFGWRDAVKKDKPQTLEMKPGRQVIITHNHTPIRAMVVTSISICNETAVVEMEDMRHYTERVRVR